MKMMYSLGAVLALVLIAAIGSGAGLQYVFGVLLPYAAFTVFLAGFAYKIYNWAKSPVPFRIPTTAGQQKTLPWIEQNKFDNPFTEKQTIVRMLLEVLTFRTLFRNTKMSIRDGKVLYGSDKWLWLAAMAFHYSFLIIVFRHLRFFLASVPGCVELVDSIDSMFQVLAPAIYLTDLLILAGLGYLLVRRLIFPIFRYISLEADYFPLVLIISIVLSGMWMRYLGKTDLIGVKQIAMGLVTLSPVVPATVGAVFYIHLTLVCALLVYFPFSKLMHMGGVFMSPTRNLPNNSRAVRHVNPWNPKVKFHTYADWEDEFREKMREADMPLEKE